MDPDVRDRILDRPRAREIAAYEAPRVTLADLREKYGRDTPDEDLILMSIVGDDAVDVVGSARSPRPPASAETPLLDLLRQLAEQDRHAFVSLQRPGLSLTLRKSESTQ
jgi:oxaloacetate decarboxylase alpha subunit